MYYVNVFQDYPMVEIQIKTSPEPFSGSISVVAVAEYDEELRSERVSIYVNANLSFHVGMSVEKAREVEGWWRIAAQGAEVLPHYFKAPEDLRRPIKATITSRAISFDWMPGSGDVDGTSA